jgi:hypothetical protein
MMFQITPWFGWGLGKKQVRRVKLPIQADVKAANQTGWCPWATTCLQCRAGIEFRPGVLPYSLFVLEAIRRPEPLKQCFGYFGPE